MGKVDRSEVVYDTCKRNISSLYGKTSMESSDVNKYA